MVDTGLHNPGTGATSGTPVWQNPDRVTTEDGNSASVLVADMPYATVSGSLRATNFGFNADIDIPDTIDGITMRFKRAASRGGMYDDDVRLFWSGAIQGNDKKSAVEWPSLSALGWSGTYGGAADTWGASPTATNVRDSGFGFAMQCINLNSVGLNSSPDVDVFEATVYFTEVSLGPEFFAQFVGVLPAVVQSFLMPLLVRGRKRSVTRRARSVICG